MRGCAEGGLRRCFQASVQPGGDAGLQRRPLHRVQYSRQRGCIGHFSIIFPTLDEQVCEDVERQECTEVEKEQCSPKTVTECNDVTTEVCNPVPKEVCDLEKKIIMVEKTEEKCSAPADIPSTTTTTSTTTVAPERENAVKPSNSYLPPPPTNAGKQSYAK